jgi:hypothetical protein
VSILRADFFNADPAPTLQYPESVIGYYNVYNLKKICLALLLSRSPMLTAIPLLFEAVFQFDWIDRNGY